MVVKLKVIAGKGGELLRDQFDLGIVSPVKRKRLSTKPVVCRTAIPTSIFVVRQVWMAASLNIRDLPLLPDGLAFKFISGSNWTASDQRLFSASF